MPVLVGIIFGVFLTIAGAYVYDAATGRPENGLSTSAAGGQAPLVNWDVVESDWNAVATELRNSIANLEKSFRRHTGQPS